MLSVAVQKDIAEYQPKIVGHLTARTLISIACALGAAVLTALYINYVLGLNVSSCTLVIMGVSLPFWACGFVKPHGIPFEQFVVYWLKATCGRTRLWYVPTMRLSGFVKDITEGKETESVNDKFQKKQNNLRGIEAYSPRASRVLV